MTGTPHFDIVINYNVIVENQIQLIAAERRARCRGSAARLVSGVGCIKYRK